MYIGEFNLNDWVTFPVQVHSVDGNAANIDAGPFEIAFYESDPASIVDPAPMNTPDATFDTVLDQKLGFYYAKVQLSAANGFAPGKQYVARIGEGIIDGVKPATVITFGIKTPFGAGLRSIDVTVTANAAPVQGASVIVKNSDNSLIVAGGATDVNGELTLLLNDGPYNVWLWKPGYTYANPAVLAVSQDATVSYALTPHASGTPAFGLQQLAGNVVTVAGAAAAGAEVVAEIVGYPQSADGAIISAQECEATVDAAGNFALTLVKGARVKLRIRESGGKPYYTKVITVTSDDTRDILDY